MTRSLSALCLLGGCTDALLCAPGYGASDAGECVAVGATGDAEPDAGSSSTLDAAEPWSAEQAAAAMQAGLDAGLPDPLTLDAAWKAAIDEGGEAGCPGSGSYSLIRGVRGCTTSDGWTFAGPADYAPNEDGEGYFLEADSYVLRPDGSGLAFGGTIAFDRLLEDGVLQWRSTISGTFQDDRADGWLREGVGADLLIKGTGLGDDASMLLSGGSSVGGAAVVLDAVDWTPACGLDGEIATVDSTGRAYRLALSCGACGPITQDGEEIGEGCLDASPVAEVARLVSSG